MLLFLAIAMHFEENNNANYFKIKQSHVMQLCLLITLYFTNDQEVNTDESLMY